MKIRVLAVILMLALAAWLPLAAQQPASGPGSSFVARGRNITRPGKDRSSFRLRVLLARRDRERSSQNRKARSPCHGLLQWQILYGNVLLQRSICGR